MSFMSLELHKDRHVLLVETYAGTEVVPCDMLGLADPPMEPAEEWQKEIQQYCEGGIVDPESTVDSVSGWVWRLSAPGYLDCTSWSYAETETEAREAAAEMYEEEEEEEEEEDEVQT